MIRLEVGQVCVDLYKSVARTFVPSLPDDAWRPPGTEIPVLFMSFDEDMMKVRKEPSVDKHIPGATLALLMCFRLLGPRIHLDVHKRYAYGVMAKGAPGIYSVTRG